MNQHYKDFFRKKTTKFALLLALMSPSVMVFAQNDKKNLSVENNQVQQTPFMDEATSTSTIFLNALHIDTKSALSQSSRKPIAYFAGKKMHLIKFKGAIKPEWYKMLTDAGAEVVDYIPTYAYMIFANYATIQSLQTLSYLANSPIEWDGAYLPEYRISPDVYGVDAKGKINKNIIAHQSFSVQLFSSETINNETLDLLTRLQTAGTEMQVQRISHYVNINVNLDANGLQQISERADVISIHPYIIPTKNDESQNMVMTGNLTGNIPNPGNYLTYLANNGFTQAQFDASNFVVNVVDDGLDNGSVGGVLNTTNHAGLYTSGNTGLSTRVAFIHKQGTAIDADTKGCDGHGNLNTHIVGGFVPDALLGNPNHTDVNGFRYGLGVAPFAKVGNSTIFRIGGSFSNPNIPNLESESYQAGGRISTNSWGSAVGGAYNTTAQTYDFLVRDAQPAGATFVTAGNQEMVIVFSAGNSGSGANTIGSPGTGKNVITVGASEGVRAFGGNDGCSISDAQANSANDIIGFSSRGPCDDGRIKPDIVTCGTHVTGGVFASSPANPIAGTGTAAACYNGSSVCGGVGSIFFPAGQEWYSASSGTSHSTPAVAGFAALIRQNFINKSLPVPSPAMTKAMIMNSAGYMNGAGANDNLYSNNQGMGTVNMNNYFMAMDNPNIIRDQQVLDMFTASGQEFSRSGVIANNAQPVRITLAYTDAPGPTSGNSFVNNLDLEVTINGDTYLGNVFTGSLSVLGGTADTRNNTECVFLPAGTTGNIFVKVKATNIAGDGVPNNGNPLDQDFALIVTNVNEQLMPVASSTGAVVTAEACGAGLVLDPQDHITVSLPITNIGTLATTNLTATLQTNAGVVFPSAPQNYGAINPGNTVSNPFSFFVNNTVNCGETITLTWDLVDGVTNMGTLSKVFSVGSLSLIPAISENFDALVVPALPVGWTQNQLFGTGINWVSSTTNPNSAPNTAFANDPATQQTTALESPVFAVQSAQATITFEKAFTTENTFDGAVFEIKIGAGAWTDILAAGGSFTIGGYNGTISGAATTTLAGRSAWTGTSAIFTPTTVLLPAAALGQNVQVRWVMASDNSVSSTGFRLDDININSNAECTPCTALPLELLSFTGKQHDGYNLLTWQTANEVNTQLFELEYATDGVNFKKGYTIMANGKGDHSYLQRDNGIWISNNVIYYRLKMIDVDGKHKYSNIVSIKNQSVASIKSSLYPNPAKAMVTLSIGDPSLLGSTAQLIDSRGVVLKSINIKYNTVNISLENYASGIYLLKLNNGEVLRINKQ
ncbi:MAG TPA: S8 family serine peptidase [Chitinophagaceae bacterium]|nr:S8 family serine peptidase [Chitinophagaceae bacterium]